MKNIVPDLGAVFRVKINREGSERVLIATFNGPAVLVAENFGDGETETGTLLGFVGLIETIEDFFEVRAFNFGAVVRNGKRGLGETDFESLLAVFDSVIEENVENLENILFR